MKLTNQPKSVIQYLKILCLRQTQTLSTINATTLLALNVHSYRKTQMLFKFRKSMNKMTSIFWLTQYEFRIKLDEMYYNTIQIHTFFSSCCILWWTSASDCQCLSISHTSSSFTDMLLHNVSAVWERKYSV